MTWVNTRCNFKITLSFRNGKSHPNQSDNIYEKVFAQITKNRTWLTTCSCLTLGKSTHKNLIHRTASPQLVKMRVNDSTIKKRLIKITYWSVPSQKTLTKKKTKTTVHFLETFWWPPACFWKILYLMIQKWIFLGQMHSVTSGVDLETNTLT